MLQFALSLRFVMLIAALGTTFGSLVMFGQGAWRMAEAAHSAAIDMEPKVAIAHVMSGTDAFLFGVVLIIFAYNITFGLVFALDKTDRRQMPKWMRPSSMQEIKTTLVSVILVYLVVDFATDWAESNMIDSWTALVKPISILLIAAALRLMGGHEQTALKPPRRIRPASARAPVQDAQNP